MEIFRLQSQYDFVKILDRFECPKFELDIKTKRRALTRRH